MAYFSCNRLQKTQNFFNKFNYCNNSIVITALHLCNGFELLNIKCKIENGYIIIRFTNWRYFACNVNM